ncbi:MAG: LysM peptidoglycan-binding domain-containing protein [Planctomycetes bacterium]|nr:LysM peptidoglycan-binding domain-containing protein [Planctomycetota bacterium]
MRILLWILLLLCAFAGVSLYHSHFTADAREQRAAAHAAALEPLPEGFNGRVVVGEKSGAPLVEGVPIQRPPNPARSDSKGDAPSKPTAAKEHLVKAGESLSGICAKYYGSSRPEIVNALSQFNGLKSPNALRSGQTLAIPPLSALGITRK